MLYAKVVVGLPIEGEFDYSVPEDLYRKIKVGVRVGIQFGSRKTLGYVVGLSKETNIKNIKPILELFDDSPVLDKNMFSLTKIISDYYGCSWGEAIETALPQDLRKGRRIKNNKEENRNIKPLEHRDAVLIHDLDQGARWDIYLNHIRQVLSKNESVIILLPDIDSVFKAKEMIVSSLGIQPTLLYRKQPKELDEWLRVRESKLSIVIGTRSGIFAPANNLGLIIIDEEEDMVYKQEQVPHYHARDVALMRIDIERAVLILGSASPSLESLYLVKKGTIKYTLLPRKKEFPQIKIIDMRYQQGEFKQKNTILSKYLEDSIIQTLNAKGKILLFLNRRGFATFASCNHCGTVFKCPRCNVNLVYHFKENRLNCHYCNFKMPAPGICPNCNSGYIKYLGTGTEKVESELARLLPQARIGNLDNLKEKNIEDVDILISTKSIIKETIYNFDLIGILSIDNSLNRIDFRATEKTFSLLIGLLALTQGKIIIQTTLPRHYSFRALENKDVNIFYDEELKQRKLMGFAPYQHLCLVKLRGKKENRVEEACNELFNSLNKQKKNARTIKVISCNPGDPQKLRGNFYWQILIKSGSALKIIKSLKLHLKNLSHSGIIVTVDMDPL